MKNAISSMAGYDVGYLWICKDIHWTSHGYATGYRVDMKGYRLDMWDNLTQDRRGAGAGLG
jgi:hypothetical protein